MQNQNTSSNSDNLASLGLLIRNNPEFLLKQVKSLFELKNNSQINLATYIKHITEGYVPVIYANHQSHADGLIISMITNQIKSYTNQTNKGFLCPVAASMASGDQDATVQGGTNILQPFFEHLGFVLVPVIREDDRVKYGMEGSNRNAIEKLLHAPEDKYGLAVFPEGSVQGGRRREDGRIKGMRHVEGGGILLRCLDFWNSLKKRIIILPVGIINSYEIFSPDNYIISSEIFDMISGKKPSTQSVAINIGKPFLYEDIEKDLGEKINSKSQEGIDYLMKKIAELLPEDAQGYYKDKI